MKIKLTITKKQKQAAIRCATASVINKLRTKGCTNKAIKDSIGRLTIFTEMVINKAPFAIIIK